MDKISASQEFAENFYICMNEYIEKNVDKKYINDADEFVKKNNNQQGKTSYFQDKFIKIIPISCLPKANNNL